jgi:hypothetical protein
MSRFGQKDGAATREAYEDGRFLDAKKRSQVLRRMDGSSRIELRGIDATNLRLACFERDHYRCVDEGNGHECHGPLQMSHNPPMSKSEGSDVLDQVQTRCWRHHILLDGHGQPMHF